jgi:hypothetical protein
VGCDKLLQTTYRNPGIVSYESSLLRYGQFPLRSNLSLALSASLSLCPISLAHSLSASLSLSLSISLPPQVKLTTSSSNFERRQRAAPIRVPFFPASCLEDHAQPRWRSSSSSLAPWLSVALSHSLSLSLTRSLSCNPPSLLSRPLSLSLSFYVSRSLSASLSLYLCSQLELKPRVPPWSATFDFKVRRTAAAEGRDDAPRQSPYLAQPRTRVIRKSLRATPSNNRRSRQRRSDRVRPGRCGTAFGYRFRSTGRPFGSRCGTFVDGLR